MPIKILMTGGTGLIGRAFINHFQGYDCTVLTRSMTAAANVLPTRVKIIDSLDGLKNLDAFDAVINLAGEAIIDKRWTTKQKAIISQSRWVITQQLVDLFASSQHPPKVFLSGSAIGVYGNRGEQVLREDSDVCQSDFASTLCVKWEGIAKQATPYTRVVVLRTGIVLTPNGGALAKMLLPFKCGLGGRVSNGQQYMSWIHIRDYIDALDFLLKKSSVKMAVNLTAPEPVTNKVFTQALAALLRRPSFFTVPKFLLQWLMGESSCLLLDSQKVVPKKLLEHDFSFRYPQINLALDHLINKSPSKKEIK